MELKQLRISKGLTQLQASQLLGVSLRSYKQYENEPNKKGSIKYRYMIEEINKFGYIDEEHGILTFESIKNIVTKVLENHEVEYCYLFGSYATNKAQPSSDVNLLVSTTITGMGFFGLAEELRENLHKKVDLLNISQLKNNQVLLNEILKKGVKIYG